SSEREGPRDHPDECGHEPRQGVTRQQPQGGDEPARRAAVGEAREWVALVPERRRWWDQPLEEASSGRGPRGWLADLGFLEFRICALALRGHPRSATRLGAGRSG